MYNHRNISRTDSGLRKLLISSTQVTKNPDIFISVRDVNIAFYGKEMIDMIRISAKTVLSGVSMLLGVGSLIVDLLKDKGKVDEAAEKAAKIVLDQLKNK